MINIVIILTVVVSALCFRDRRLFDRLSLKPYFVYHRRQWDRVVTHGFVHGDWTHLIVNMFVFLSFGMFVMESFRVQYVSGVSFKPEYRFLLLYIGGIAVASLYDVFRRRNEPYYTSVGASGGVSAVVFTSVFLKPMSNIYLMAIIPMPAILFAVLYIAYESWSARNPRGRVNHHAHLAGAVYGFVFPVLTGGVSQLDIFLNGFR